jgi:hypothetical protein
MVNSCIQSALNKIKSITYICEVSFNEKDIKLNQSEIFISVEG